LLTHHLSSAAPPDGAVVLGSRGFVARARIVRSARANPITHRYFDITALPRAFPTFAPTSLETGLAWTFGAAPLPRPVRAC
jgi:hypothetical protein